MALLSRIPIEDRRWFFRLKRPRWLVFEPLIPLIWIVIMICGGWSTYAAWEASQSQFLMLGYYLLLLLIMSYTTVLCQTRSLKFGTLLGAVGFVLGLILALSVLPFSRVAFGLLLPYLLWSPIGTYVTWAMVPLNPTSS
ncbi:MAG: tryptophan-rich sensory protein [Cyanobacteria bacterium P01_F01_bin.42]